MIRLGLESMSSIGSLNLLSLVNCVILSKLFIYFEFKESVICMLGVLWRFKVIMNV